MKSQTAVLFANEAFYAAFSSGDLLSMERVWASKHPISCLHPGWEPLLERADVMDSWASILSSGDTSTLRFVEPKARVLDTTAYVICHEIIGQSSLIATNIFVQEDAQWRMVHHQAGGSPPPETIGTPDTHKTAHLLQ